MTSILKGTGLILSILLLSCNVTQQGAGSRSKPLAFITPPEGMKTIPAAYINDLVPISWKGGPEGNVAISLIDWCNWTVFRGINPAVPNTGLYNWRVPEDLPCGIYNIYITETGQAPTDWRYSVPIAILKKEPGTKK